jgi:hypothetical protein
MPPKSLFERCQGAGAISVAKLIQQGEAAADSLIRDYGKHIQDRLDELESLAKTALDDRWDEKKWGTFLTALHDVQSSGATAGSVWTEKYAIALQRQLGRREKTDGHLPLLIALHLDAIRLAANGNASHADLMGLGDRLSHASEKLALGPAQAL